MEHLFPSYAEAETKDAPSWCSRFVSCVESLPGILQARHGIREVREVRFRSQRARMSGFLILPTRHPGSPPPPVVIFGHGLSCTQAMGLVNTAQEVVQRTGFAALTFDHFSFGRSGPLEARAHFSHWLYAVGYLDAITYLVQHEAAHVDVDRICLWGESLSSRIVLVVGAIERARVKAVIAVTPPCGRQPSTDATAPEAATAAEARDAETRTARPAFERMAAHLAQMRTSTSDVDDASQGADGGAFVPDVTAAYTMRIMPWDRVTGRSLTTQDRASKFWGRVEPAPAAAKAAAQAVATAAKVAAPAEALGESRESRVDVTFDVDTQSPILAQPRAGAPSHRQAPAPAETPSPRAEMREGSADSPMGGANGMKQQQRQQHQQHQQQAPASPYTPLLAVDHLNGAGRSATSASGAPSHATVTAPSPAPTATFRESPRAPSPAPTAPAPAVTFAPSPAPAAAAAPTPATTVPSPAAAAESQDTASRAKARRGTLTWLREDRRCKDPEKLIDFLNTYSQLPGAMWSNEIIRVELAESVPWSEQAALPFIEAATFFIVAEHDEMENCNKAVQYETFRRLRRAAAPSAITEVPCSLGGHVGMMDALGLVGQKSTWEGMVRETARLLLAALAAGPPPTA